MKRFASVFLVLCLGTTFQLQSQNLPEDPSLSETIFADTVLQFHFVPGRDMFYARYKQNEINIQHFLNILKQQNGKIRQGKVKVKVEGFCASAGQKQKFNLSLAKIRSNRVKSFFITHSGLKEADFRTHNTDTASSEKNNTVRLSLLYPPAPLPIDGLQKETVILPDVENLQEESVVSEELTARQDSATEEQPTIVQPLVSNYPVRKTLFSIKTNLLYDLALTPNLELEVPIGKRWSINAEYQYGWWLRKDNSFCWQIEVGGLEGRYWFGNRRKREVLTGWFAGLFAGGGMYDFQLKKDEGRQGEFYIMMGVSAGYALPVAKNLHLEFSTGVGGLVTNYRRYRIINDELIKQGLTMKYKALLPVKAKVSLIWVINSRKDRKGTGL